jgi:hypothetical protein
MSEKIYRNPHGYEAWACWNSCQGVFTDAVFHSKADAMDAMKGNEEVYDKVVPVRVHIEPESEWEFREWKEKDLRG